MNHRMIRYILLWILKIEGFFLLLPTIVGFLYSEYREAVIYLIVAGVCVIIGQFSSVLKPKNTAIFQKEGFSAVALCWVVLSLFGALPFVMTGEIPSYVDALFEIVSGFTTTGSSILSDVEALSHASLFWRSLSHWLGGMGVLVFALMIMPVKNGSQMNLMKAESPGPEVSKFVPKVRDTAVLLYKIYIFMTLLQVVILLITGMEVFDSFCITFGTAGTGGFAILNSGCATYTPVQQWVITIFMILFGVNFTFYFYIVSKKLGAAFKMEEVRAYILIILVSIAIITINISSMYENTGDALRDASFQVGTIITTTGYSTTDFNLWPSLSKAILLFLMFCGACAGSTGGGLKVSRVLILIKSVRKEVHMTLRPRRIEVVRIDGKAVDERQRHAVNVYLIAFLVIFVLSFLIISIDGYSFETNFSAVAATINNIGPGFDVVGATGNFGGYSVLSKLVLTFDMLAGRLEILPMLTLLSPTLWSSR